ncbi:MAG: Tad domain-containing protein [Candidatus Obscuribacter sp.]|nr:Tad domain-containing protein [Candidatus Obscuribacter sp.]
MFKARRRKVFRNESGAMASVLLLLTCLGLLIVGSIGIDVSHAFYVRAQLQAAADNAALTGAYYLCSLMPGQADIKRSEEMARKMAARSVIDGNYFEDDGEASTLVYSPEVRCGSAPQVCRISMSRPVHTSFGRLVGCHTIPVSVSSQAGAFCGTRTVAANWLTNLAISHKVQKENKLDLDPVSEEHNAWFIQEWSGQSNPVVKMGSTNVSRGPANLAALEKGRVYNVAIVKGEGAKGENRLPPSSEVIGTTSLIVISTESATSARIKLVPGGLIKGQPGSYLVPGSTGDVQFVLRNGHWRVALMK